MPYYDFVCDNCEILLEDFFKSINDPIPNCDKCNKPMEQDFTNTHIAFQGLTTPGSNSYFSPGADQASHKLPSELRRWFKHRKESNNYIKDVTSKKIEWPDGTVS